MMKRCAVLVLICLAGLAMMLPGYADAQGSLLTAAVTYGGQPVVGMDITLCRAADLLESGKYAAAPAFASFGAAFDAMMTGSSIALAATLDSFAAEYKITRTTGRTGAQGRVVFTGLAPGLYLLAQAGSKNAEYVVAPGLVLVTGRGVTIYPKTERRPTGKTVNVSVYKVWAGAKTHPPSVQAQLYRNGKAYGEAVTLNAANHWRHNWNGLDNAFTWTVDEVRVPDGYIKSVSGSVGAGFVILNVSRKQPSNDKPPDTSDESTPALWLCLMGLSLLALAVLIIALWRQKRRETTAI